MEESVLSIGKFNSMVSLAAFFPFKSAQAALENMNAISEGKDFLLCGSFGVLSCNDVFIICQSPELLCWQPHVNPEQLRKALWNAAVFEYADLTIVILFQSYINIGVDLGEINQMYLYLDISTT